MLLRMRKGDYMTFKSTDELKSYLLSKMQPAISTAEEKVYQVIDKILAQWYGEYDPVLYERTRQLLHSLVKSNVTPTANGYEAEVYFDASKLDYSFKYINGQKYPHQGASSEDVMQAAMNGGHGAVGWKIAATTTPIWDKSVGLISAEVYDVIKQALISEGIPVK